MRVVELKALVRERGLRSYSRLRKAELTALLRNNPPPRPPPPPAPRTRPPRSTRAPPPPPPLPLVRFRPDRPRQPELLRKLEERNPQLPPLAGRSDPRASAPTLKPYQIKTKQIKAVTSCSTHKIDQQETDG